MPKRSAKRRQKAMPISIPKGLVLPEGDIMDSYLIKLGSQKDHFNEKSKFTFGLTGAANSISYRNFYPFLMGQRAISVANVFTRFRINRLVLRFTSIDSDITVGLDDDVVTTAEAPTGASSVFSCRTSVVAARGSSRPSVIEWTPIDKSKWYYTFQGAESRLTVPVCAYWSNTGTSVTCEVYYEITYAGATNNSST